MDFRIDKKNLVNRFKDYIKKFDDEYSNYKPSHSKRLSTPTKYYVLDRLRSLYYWVTSEIILDLRHEFIHNDDEFARVKGELENYIRNKIRIKPTGQIYLMIKDVEFTGDLDQYKDHILHNRTKLISLFGKIIDELNDFFSGDLEIDKNKPVLNDTLKNEQVDNQENKEIFISDDNFNLKSVMSVIK